MIASEAHANSALEVIQLSVQVIGMTAVILTLYVYYRQLRTMEAQHRTLEREVASRMRPWIGLYDFGINSPALPSAGGNETLRVLLRNSGPLPAQKARLSLIVRPEPAGETDAPNHWEETRIKALVPGEEGNYTFPISRFPQFGTWREQKRDIVISGNMVYSLDERSFRTEFEAALRYSEPFDDLGHVKTRWRNRILV